MIQQRNTEPIDSFGVWIKTRRNILNISRDELARRVGCAVITLRKIEADERRPSVQIAERLATHLELPKHLHATFVRAARAEVGVRRLAAPAQLQATAHPSTEKPFSNVPVHRTPIVGRDADVTHVAERLLRTDVGLLTLTGPPGVGKTRLSVEAAARLAHAFRDGIWFVELAHIRDPALVVSAIAQTLRITKRFNQALEQRVSGIDSSAQSLEERVIAFCSGRQMLLVLDNFEQVVAAAPLLSRLLAAAPDLKLLVTSRAALHVSDEHEIAVRPLSLPHRAETKTLETVRDMAAINLFVQRAQAVQADFALTETNAPTIADICSHLDGLPLAIELAAARIKVLSPTALLQRLSHRLHVLTDGRRDVSPRHQTLRNAIAWSYELLEQEEQYLFRRLSVFAGGFSIPAVEAVCPELSITVLDGLAALVDNSLVQQRETNSDEPSFYLLETVREYAREQLEAHDEIDIAQRRHAAYYLQLAEEAEPQLQGSEQITWLDRLEAELDNLRAALTWSLDHNELDHALRLGAALWLFWQVRGYISEGRACLDAMIQRTASTKTVPRVRVLNGAGILAWCQSDLTRAYELCTASLTLAQELGDHEGIAHAYSNLGTVATKHADYTSALSYCTQSLELSRELGLTWLSAWALTTMGYALHAQQQTDQAIATLEQGLALFRSIGGIRGSAMALLFLADLTSAQGDLEQTELYAAEGLDLSRAIHDTIGVACANEMLAAIAHARGDYQRAMTLLEENLSLWHEQDDAWHLSWIRLFLSHLAYRLGDLQRAVELLDLALSIKRECDHPERLAVSCLVCAELAAHAGNMEQAVQMLANAAGIQTQYSMQLDRTITREHDQLLDELREKIDPDVFARCWAAGQGLPLAQARDNLLEIWQELKQRSREHPQGEKVSP